MILFILLRLSIYTVPWIIEIIVLKQLEAEPRLISVLIISILQNLLGLYSGIDLIRKPQIACSNDLEDVFCGANLVLPTSFWWIVNAFETGFATDANPDSPSLIIASQILLYTPFLSFGLGAAIGCMVKNTHDDPIKIRILKCCAFICYLLFIFVPAVFEITLSAIFDDRSIIVFVSALTQSIAATLGGISFVYQLKDEARVTLFNHSPFDFRSLITGVYVLYSIPIWLIVNLFVCWFSFSSIPWMTFGLCWAPICLYPFGVGIGYWLLHDPPERMPLLRSAELRVLNSVEK